MCSDTLYVRVFYMIALLALFFICCNKNIETTIKLHMT
jgi:hypothetical protein